MGAVCKITDCGEELTDETRYRKQLVCITHGKAAEKARARYRQLNDRKFYMNKMWCALRQRSTKESMGSNAYGKPYLTFPEFWSWYEDTKEIFEAMFQDYKDSGFDKTLAPSIDRKDSDEGYHAGNMQWLTLADNSSKGNKSESEFRYLKKVNRTNEEV